MSNWPQLYRQIDWLNESLQVLKSRVQSAIAAEISRLFSETVQEVLQLLFQPPGPSQNWEHDPDDSWDEEDKHAPPVEPAQPLNNSSWSVRLLQAARQVLQSYSPLRPIWWSVGLAIGASVTALSPEPFWQSLNTVFQTLSDLLYKC